MELVFINDKDINPTIAAKDPPKHKGIITALNPGMAKTAQDVHKDPSIEYHNVLWTLDKKIWRPLFFKIVSIVKSVLMF